MFKTYNKENNTYSRYIHISEIEATLEKMKKISSRVQYKSIDDIPDGNQVEDYHLTIDDAKSLEKMFADNPAFKLESPMDTMRRTILLIACGMSEDTEGIEYLINKGAEINRNDLFGENALMYIIQNPNMPMEEKLKAVQLLIDHGIDVNWINTHFETPLMMALNQIEIEVADLLIDNGGIVYKPPFRPQEQNTEEENKE
ncbi:MAG: ankyrin repeat domain-containing protein [Alphaproteobacteria bacterium]|nr:ankyrin repeat domain-containing protein [Alphaproteobacteria bacterium]